MQCVICGSEVPKGRIYPICVWCERKQRRADPEKSQDKALKPIKIALLKGGCAARWDCKNIRKSACSPTPKNNQDFVLCAYYERQVYKNEDE